MDKNYNEQMSVLVVDDEPEIRRFICRAIRNFYPDCTVKQASDGLPGDWITLMKESIRTLAPQFCTRRMVIEYFERLYLPAVQEQHIPDKVI